MRLSHLARTVMFQNCLPFSNAGPAFSFFYSFLTSKLQAVSYHFFKYVFSNELVKNTGRRNVCASQPVILFLDVSAEAVTSRAATSENISILNSSSARCRLLSPALLRDGKSYPSSVRSPRCQYQVKMLPFLYAVIKGENVSRMSSGLRTTDLYT